MRDGRASDTFRRRAGTAGPGALGHPGVHNSLRQVGQVFGVAVLGALVYARLPPTASAGPPLPRPQAELFVDGLHSAIWLSGLALLATAALGAVLLTRVSPAARSGAG